MLGEGGMGTVYEGQNVRIGHRVAIKVLHAELEGRQDVIERFEREAQAAGRIGSEHIAEVYDLGELPGGTRYMVMEYLDGENLAVRVQREGRIRPQAAAPIFLHVLEALAAAHAAGIVHRDLKPENIFLVRDKKTGRDFAKLVDFGVSKFNYAAPHSGSMTRTGSVIGTPFYMSPEQAKGVKLTDHRSDLYSLGVVLYECATGRVPFHAETFNELMFKIVLEEAPDPVSVATDIDPYFSAIIRKAMARLPEARYQDAISFQDDVLAWMRSVGVDSGAMDPLLSSLTPTANRGPSAGPLGETALSMPAGLTPLPSPTSAQSNPGAGPSTLLSNTGGSLPGAASTAVPPSPRKTGSVVTGVAVALAIAAGAVLVARKKMPAAHETAAVAAPQAQAAAPPPVAPVSPTAVLTVPPSSEPLAPLAAAPAPEAGPSTETHAAVHHYAPSLPRPAVAPPPPKPVATAAAVAPTNATAEQLKGRTIRTDL
jgi:serine/threonine-protein kinase